VCLVEGYYIRAVSLFHGVVKIHGVVKTQFEYRVGRFIASITASCTSLASM